jgi:hypothetical protein
MIYSIFFIDSFYSNGIGNTNWSLPVVPNSAPVGQEIKLEKEQQPNQEPSISTVSLR